MGAHSMGRKVWGAECSDANCGAQSIELAYYMKVQSMMVQSEGQRIGAQYIGAQSR